VSFIWIQEAEVRGVKLSKNAKTYDVVLTAVRYAPEGRVELARGYARRGVVWGDRKLFDRNQILDLVAQKKKIATGIAAETPGDFEVWEDVTSRSQEDGDSIYVTEPPATGDALALPLF
jgi:hypothetical protein